MKLKLSHLSLFFSFALVVSASYAEGYKVVVHKSVALNEISKKTLNSIYLGDTTYWKNSDKIVPASLNDKNSVMKTFVNDVLGKSISDYTTHWRRKLFSGRGIPPRRFTNDQELLSFISSTENSIGVINEVIPLDGKVKIIEVTD
tara:strand:+ start:87939 stop:88373 length:435 start_codon:yes stop_codon:yes gene_type:complete